jgi:hypothetical protein
MHRRVLVGLLGLAVLGFFIANLADHDPFSLIFADNTSTLWTWGYNNDGQLGGRSTTDKNTPIQESTKATNWSSIAAGYYHTVGLKSDGTFWAWGSNGKGSLGNGTNVDKTTPTQESTGATDWAAIAAGTSHTVALKSGDSQPTPTPIPNIWNAPATSGWGLAALIAGIFVVMAIALGLTSGPDRLLGRRPLGYTAPRGRVMLGGCPKIVS